MQWNTSTRQCDPFVALRRDFERQLGLESAASFAEMSVVEHSDRWVISLDVPGISENDVQITFESGSLVIAGERKASLSEDAKEVFSDRSFGKFRRVLKVHESVDQNSIQAELDAGVLKITLKRIPAPSPIKISVRSSQKQD